MWSVTTMAMAAGWVGAAASLLAYALVSAGRLASDSLRFHALNLVACVLLAVVALSTRTWPSMVTNLGFLVVGVHMVWKVRGRLVVRLRAVRSDAARTLRRAAALIARAGARSVAPVRRAR